MRQSNKKKLGDSEQTQHQEEPQMNLQQQQALMYHIQDFQMLSSGFHRREDPNIVNNGFYPGDIPNNNLQQLDIHTHNMMPIVGYPTPATLISLENSYNSPLIDNTATNHGNQPSYSQTFQHQSVHQQEPFSIVPSQSKFIVEQSLETRTQRKEQDVFKELISMARNNNTTIQQQKEPTGDNLWQFRDFLDAKASSNMILNEQALIQKKEQPKSISLSSDKKQDTPVFPLKSKSNLTYELKIVQQPVKGRMFGFGNKDRRPISPPPILQLIVKTNDGKQVDIDTFDVSFLIVICDLCPDNEIEKEHSGSSIPTSQFTKFSATESDEQGIAGSSVQLRSLTGSLATSASKLYDLDGNLGIFFVFQDISLRSEGQYKLQFILVDIESPDFYKINTASVSKVLQTVESDTLTIYSIKRFPGVAQTTPLSQCFARQGMKLPTRRIPKDTTAIQPTNSLVDEDEEEYEY